MANHEDETFRYFPLYNTPNYVLLRRLRIVQRAGRDLDANLKDRSATFPNIIYFLAQYRSACEDLMFQDFEYSIGKDIESKLWDSHGKVNNVFRKGLKHFKKAAGKKKPVERRRIEKNFLDFIKSSQRYYRGHVQKLAATFGGIPELGAVANRLTLSTLLVDNLTQASGSLAHSVLLSCHQSLVRLGDLSRWRETELVTKDRNWGPAISYYDLARIIRPISGASHNQLAVIALADGSHLRATYHLYRALAVEEPHPSAKGNLQIEFKKIEDAEASERNDSSSEARDSPGPGDALIICFMRLHARCYKGSDASDVDNDGKEMMLQLAIALKGRSLERDFAKLISINIAAEYFAGERLKADVDSTEMLKSYLSFLRINVMTFLTLLHILLSEFEPHFESEKLRNGNGSGSKKLSTITRRLLPALRNYSSWLTCNAAILAAGVGDTALTIQVKEFWKTYACTLTLLVSKFPVSELPPPIGYLLEEDEDTLGFKPLDSEHARQRYCDDATGARKPRCYDRGIDREHVNVEMFQRIRDFLTDGMIVQSQEDVPINLKETTFVYCESGNHPKEVSHGPHDLRYKDDAEVTHVDETTFSQDIDPVSKSGSQTDLTSVSMDPASRRMVEDLVNSENLDGGQAESLNPKVGDSSANEVGDETSYGLFGTSTASELGLRTEQQNQPAVTPRPLLPSIHNSPFALQPGGKGSTSRPETAKRTTPSHSRQSSQTMFQMDQLYRHNTESSQISMPEPTNPNPPLFPTYPHQPYTNVTYSSWTDYTTGAKQSVAHRNDLDGCHFISPTIDFGCSGSVKGTTNVHTPPNGQGTG